MKCKRIKFLLPVVAVMLTGCVTRTYTVTRPPPGPSLAEVEAMLQAHVSDTVIASQIQNSSDRYVLTASQIIALKADGASDTVLNALINSASKPVAQTTTVEQDAAVYPYVSINPWPWFWWDGGPYYRGGYYYGHADRRWR